MEPEGAKIIWERSTRKNISMEMERAKAFLAVKETYKGTKVKKVRISRKFSEERSCPLRSLKENVKGLSGKRKLANAMIDQLQNYYGITFNQNKEDLKNIQTAVRATSFCVASSKKNTWHYPHCPERKYSWCKFLKDRANGRSSYKSGPDLLLDIFMKMKPIFAELSDERLLEKCLYGKIQNQNESFNSMIWDWISKARYVSLTQLEPGVYDAVANFNISKKACFNL